MSDPFDIVVRCESPEQVGSVLLDINNNRLPRGSKKAFSDLILGWMVQHTDDVILAMVNGKTVRQLLNEYGSIRSPTPIESGERDGVKWALHDPPADPDG